MQNDLYIEKKFTTRQKQIHHVIRLQRAPSVSFPRPLCDEAMENKMQAEKKREGNNPSSGVALIKASSQDPS